MDMNEALDRWRKTIAEDAAAKMRERAAMLAERPPHWPRNSGNLTDHIAKAIRALPLAEDKTDD